MFEHRPLTLLLGTHNHTHTHTDTSSFTDPIYLHQNEENSWIMPLSPLLSHFSQYAETDGGEKERTGRQKSKLSIQCGPHGRVWCSLLKARQETRRRRLSKIGIFCLLFLHRRRRQPRWLCQYWLRWWEWLSVWVCCCREWQNRTHIFTPKTCEVVVVHSRVSGRVSTKPQGKMCVCVYWGTQGTQTRSIHSFSFSCQPHSLVKLCRLVTAENRESSLRWTQRCEIMWWCVCVCVCLAIIAPVGSHMTKRTHKHTRKLTYSLSACPFTLYYFCTWTEERWKDDWRPASQTSHLLALIALALALGRCNGLIERRWRAKSKKR